MKTNNDYADQLYSVSGRNGFGLTEALRLWKAKYPEYVDFKKDVIKHESLEDFGIFVKEVWDTIEPVTVAESFKQDNLEVRRVYFNCVGIRRMFAELKPELIDSQTITKSRVNWDEDNNEEVRVFKDVYELYKIDKRKLVADQKEFEDIKNWRLRQSLGNDIFAVRCWCTTTNREYWIYVPESGAMLRRSFEERMQNVPPTYDAIQAIAWTIRINVSNPERIYRQGDIIVVKKGKDSADMWNYNLSKQQYLDLMYSET